MTTSDKPKEQGSTDEPVMHNPTAAILANVSPNSDDVSDKIPFATLSNGVKEGIGGGGYPPEKKDARQNFSLLDAPLAENKKKSAPRMETPIVTPKNSEKNSANDASPEASNPVNALVKVVRNADKHFSPLADPKIKAKIETARMLLLRLQPILQEVQKAADEVGMDLGTVPEFTKVLAMLAPGEKNAQIREIFLKNWQYDGDLHRAIKDVGLDASKPNVIQRVTRSRSWAVLMSAFFPTHILLEASLELLHHPDWRARNATLDRIHKLRGDYEQQKQLPVQSDSSLIEKTDDELRRIAGGDVQVNAAA